MALFQQLQGIIFHTEGYDFKENITIVFWNVFEGKNSIFEGGVRVPAFIYGPNFNVPSGKLHKKFTAHIDWGPTLLSIIDEASSNSHISNFIDDVDGMNFMPSIRKEPQAKERTRFLLHQNVLAPQ